MPRLEQRRKTRNQRLNGHPLLRRHLSRCRHGRPTRIINSPPPPVAPATIARDANRRATLRAVQLTDSLEMDGVLDEDVYDTVPSFGDFIQQIPLEGEPSTERTEAWVFYDSEHVYVAGRLWDSASEARWIVNEMRRDSPNLFPKRILQRGV